MPFSLKNLLINNKKTMKNFFKIMILSFFVCLFASIETKAQDKTYVFDSDALTYIDAVFTAADTISKYDTLYSVVVNATQHKTPLTQDLYIKITKVSGTPRIVVKLQGKKFDLQSTWTDIGTVTWYGGVSGSDTAFTISNATANRYRYFRVYFDANKTAQKSLLSKLQFKVYKE